MQVPSDSPYSTEPWPQVERNFAAAVTLIDESVGHLMTVLQEEGLDESTLFIFTSDNGPHSAGGHDAAVFESSGGLRGIKRDLYEGGIRVPTMARWPGVIEAGTTSSTPWALFDILPTFAELSGVSAPTGIDGISIAGELSGGPRRSRDSLYWEFRREGVFTQAARIEQFKGVRRTDIVSTARGPQAFEQPIEVYDLFHDPRETTDISSATPRISRELGDLMTASHTDSDEWPGLG